MCLHPAYMLGRHVTILNLALRVVALRVLQVILALFTMFRVSLTPQQRENGLNLWAARQYCRYDRLLDVVIMSVLFAISSADDWLPGSVMFESESR